MKNNKRIIILCGGKFAFTSIQLLAFEKYLCGIGIGKGEEAIVDALEKESNSNHIAFNSFPNKNSLSKMKDWIEAVQPDFIFSISFPFLIPETILSYGPNKFINFHPGPLPSYRGAMPIFEVLKNQEKETAICVHFINNEFDAGPIIFNDPIPINKKETYGSLTVKLSKRMAQVVLNTANMLQFARIIPSQVQNDFDAYYYEKPKLEDTFINWKKMSADEILALINACNPWNTGADAILNGEQVKIISAIIINLPHHHVPGSLIERPNLSVFSIACKNNQQLVPSILKTEEGLLTAEEYFLKNRNTLYSMN